MYAEQRPNFFHSVKAVEGDAHACTIEIEGIKTLVASRLSLYTLQHFKAHNGLRTIPRMEQSKSISSLVYEEIDGKILLKGQTLFDISYLDRLDLRGVSFVLVCDYRDLLVLPFLIHKKRFEGTVLITQPMYYFGRLLLEQFCTTIKNANMCRQSLLKPDYFEESYAYDLFEERFGYRVEDWQQLYGEADVQAMWKRCVRLNYGQIHSECGLDVVPYASGGSMATAMWLLQSHRTKYTLVYADDLSVHSWRHCLSAEATRLLQFGTIHAIVLGSNCQKNEQQSSDEELQVFLNDVEKQLRSGRTCTVLVDDLLDVLDLADILLYKIQTAYKQVYVYNLMFQAQVKYANSLVEYLNQYLKGKIFADPPLYPFSSLDSLSQSGRFSFGDMAKAALDNRVPLKELQYRHSPTLNFELSSDQLLNQNNSVVVTHRKMYDRRATASELKQWLDKVQPAVVYSYSSVDHPNVRTVEYESIVRLGSSTSFHYQCPTWSGFPIRAFVLANNELKPPEGRPNFLLIVPNNWQKELQARLFQQGIETISCDDPPALHTRWTRLELANYTFSISSSSPHQADAIYKSITEICRQVRL